ncbi:MAG: L,D-transpeptidase [Rhizobacter sp.]|nr:L,D-transpeptidase [Rhizobacter sp.]
MHSTTLFHAAASLAALALATLLALAPPAAHATTPEVTPAATDTLSADARYVHGWALANDDNAHQPFAIVDKKAARLYVFDAQGRLLGAASALLGQAAGDHAVAGVAHGDLNLIPLADRTTPAGRFASQPGRTFSDTNVWLDYDAALAIHRVRPGASKAARLARLATGSPADNRASLGCVVVAPEFYDAVVQPTLGAQRGVVYVLPEGAPVQAVFGTPARTVAQQR